MFDRQTRTFCAAVTNCLPELPEKAMQGWIENPSALKQALTGALSPAGTETSEATNPPVFPLTLNPALTAKQRIAAGRYDWWNKNLLKYHREDEPIYTGRELVTVNTELIHFGRGISTDAVLAEMGKLGYRPANFEELTAFGAERPEIQRQYPVVALRSVFVSPLGGSRCSPCLGESGAGRWLSLFWHDYGWFARCRFAAVRK